MSKSIKLKNDNYWDSSSIVHKKSLLSDILTKLLDTDILYASNTGTVAPASGNSVILNKSVTNYQFVLVVHKNGVAILTTENNKENHGNGINIHWYNNGLHGTFYSNTIYAIIGIK